MKSWDGFANGAGAVRLMFPDDTDIPVRVVPWTCPYAQEQVPQVNEKVEMNEYVYTIDGMPYKSLVASDGWCVRALLEEGGSTSLRVADILKLPAPTVELPNGKKYLASDVMERCTSLKEVDF